NVTTRLPRLHQSAFLFLTPVPLLGERACRGVIWRCKVMRISTNLIRAAAAILLAIGAATTPASADVVHDWNVQLLRVPAPVGPPQARLLAIMHVAMHDAINSITGEYDTYGPQVTAPFGASPV